MNRIEDALLRARRAQTLPDAATAPSADALEQFSASKKPPVPSPSELLSRSERSSATGEDGHPGQAVVHPATATRASANPRHSFVGRLVVNDDVKNMTVEQYRRLAATLHARQNDDGTKVVMVASALAGEGKTLTAVNLALTLSQSYGRRVLLIDADLRRPMMHIVFQVPNGPGLSEGLKADSDQKLMTIEVMPRLSLLRGGQPDPDPMRGLSSDRMQRVIDEAVAKFDWVVLDTPPVGLLTDANLLAAMVHVAVLVVRAGRTPCTLIQRAIERVDRSRVIGVVLNWVDEAVASDGAYRDYSAYNAQPSLGR